MSKQQNQTLRAWKDVEDNLRRDVGQCHKGTLSARDAATYSDALLLQAMALTDFLADRQPERGVRIHRWLHAIGRIPPATLGAALKVWTLYFRNYFTWNSSAQTYTGFKHQFRAAYPFTGEFFSPVKEELETFLKTPCPSSFTILNFHIQFLSRLTLQDIDYQAQCLKDYIESEKHLERFHFDYPLLDSLNEIVREWFQDFTLEGFHPQHGPGSVAHLSSRAKVDKYKAFKSDMLLDYFVRRLPGDCGDFCPAPPALGLDRTCQVVFVPKSVLTRRTISMEPPILQYYQQGLWGCIDRHLSRHPYLRRVVDIHSQDRNRYLAGVGSANRGSYATLDLSAASDTVAWELVKRVLHGTPLLRGCYATRSRWALLPDGSRVSLLKFAPMGSALCFPIECIIFAAICEYVARTRGVGRDVSNYSVYGDDIAVKVELSKDVIHILGKCGFLVNTSKSFIAQNLPFRESCGGEFFSGVEVSPFRLSRRFSSALPNVKSPSVFQAHIDACNLAHQYGLKLVRLWFIHRLLALPKRLQPIFTEDDSGLFSEQPTNYHLSRKKSREWQCDVLICGGISTTSTEPELCDEAIRLFEWLRLARFRSKREFPFFDSVITGDITQSKPILRPRRVSLG